MFLTSIWIEMLCHGRWGLCLNSVSFFYYPSILYGMLFLVVDIYFIFFFAFVLYLNQTVIFFSFQMFWIACRGLLLFFFLWYWFRYLLRFKNAFKWENVLSYFAHIWLFSELSEQQWLTLHWFFCEFIMQFHIFLLFTNYHACDPNKPVKS